MPLTNESFLPDAADCAETWRTMRWPEGVRCVDCGAAAVTCRTECYRGHLCRYRCDACGRWFNDLSGTPLEYSKVSLNRWVYLLRELDKGQPVTQIAEEIEVSYPTALSMAHTVRQALYEQRGPWRTFLTGEMEADDIHVKGGQQGRTVPGRPPRARGLSQRGRGTYAGDRPLLCLWTARGSPHMVLEMVPDAAKRTLARSAQRHVAPGSRIDTDSWSGYNALDTHFDHRTVKHSDEYVTDAGVHCNTAEAEWSVFKPFWRTFRGVAKRYIYRYLAQYEFARIHRELSRLQRTHLMIAALLCLLIYMIYLFLVLSF